MAPMPGLRPLQPGLRLRGWTLVEQLGIGGDGEVWTARDPAGHLLALKARPREDGAQEQRIRQEFERLRTLRIPNVVRVLEVDADQGFVFFTMELAHGEQLDQYVRAAPDLARRVGRAAAAGAGLARALGGIHRLRLVHRDVKPANVLVAGAPEGGEVAVTVLDFGTSRFGAVAEEDDLAGTVHYMAPEQRIGLPHGHEVDLYALGVCLHEVISGLPARQWTPGRPRPSLALLGPAVPLALAHLVDRLLALDPAERPSAEEAQDLLERVAQGRALPPAPWPVPTQHLGDAGRLLDENAIVVGVPGSGRRRMVQEARWLWYRQGCRSVSGTCRPDEPWSALAEVLGALLGPLDAAARRALTEPDAALLAAVHPEVPLPPGAAPARAPEPPEVGRAVGRLLARAAPLAVALWDLDAADPGTARALAMLVHHAGERVRIWATARRPGAGLRSVLPPAWTPEAHAAVLAELLPGHAQRPPPGPTPLTSLAGIWRVLAQDRGVPGPPAELPADLVALSVLQAPFPREVAERLVPDLRTLLLQDHLQPWQATEGGDTATIPRGQERLDWTDGGTALLARTAPADRAALALAAARAWRDSRGQPDRVRQAAALATSTGRPAEKVLVAAVREELGRGRPGELDRWLRLRELYHPGAPDDFDLAYARLLVELELRPGQVGPGDLRALAARAADPRQQGLAAYLQVVADARRGDRAQAAELGHRQARALAEAHPQLAADLLREVALANLARGELQLAVRDARDALRRAQQGARQGLPEGAETPLSRSEVTAMTTLSAALLYAGRVREAVAQCEAGALRCRTAGLPRGEGALLANQGIGLLVQGQRGEAAAALARCRQVQGQHRDPIVLANLAVTQARLAVERGDLAAARVLVDEGLTAAEATADPHLMGEAWCVVLEAALHTADAAEAQRALAAYDGTRVGSSWDHWPAVLARWRWLTGDLEGALRATEEPREGHGEACIRAERARLLLIAGRYPAAAQEARTLAEVAEALDQAEIARFARIVQDAASGAADAEAAPRVLATRTSGWVHLYLGALHLDALRRRLRGENVDALLRQLRARSRDLGHQLYEALARAEGW